MALFNDRHAEYDILDENLCACDGLFLLPVEEKAFSGLPQAPQKRPSGFQGSEQVLNLSKSNCFPLDFGELPIPNTLGYRSSQVSPRRLKSALGLPRLRTAPKPFKMELFSLGLWRASDTEYAGLSPFSGLPQAPQKRPLASKAPNSS